MRKVFWVGVLLLLSFIVSCSGNPQPFAIVAKYDSGSSTINSCQSFCGTGTVCDKTDGKCLLPGTNPCDGLCSAGTTCDYSTDQCVLGDACQGRCSAGTTCNSGTGQCTVTNTDPCLGHCNPPSTVCDATQDKCVPGSVSDGGSDGSPVGNDSGKTDSSSPVDSGKDSATGDSGKTESGTPIDSGSDTGKSESGPVGNDAGKTDSGTTDTGTDSGLACGGYCSPLTVCNTATGKCVALPTEAGTGLDAGLACGGFCVPPTICNTLTNKCVGGTTTDAGSSKDAGAGSDAATHTEAGTEAGLPCGGFCDPLTTTCDTTSIPNKCVPIVVDAGAKPEAGSGNDAATHAEAGTDASLPCGGFCDPLTTTCDTTSIPNKCVPIVVDAGAATDAGSGSDAATHTEAGSDTGTHTDAAADASPPCNGKCGTGTVCSAGFCIPGAIDAGKDATHTDSGTDGGSSCGATCGTGTVCSGGLCVVALPCNGLCQGGTVCNQTITPNQCQLNNDAGTDAGKTDAGSSDAGACGVTCGTGTVCSGGLCVPAATATCTGTGVCASAPGCMKAEHLHQGKIVTSDSSADNNSCQSSPWESWPIANDVMAYAVNLTSSAQTFNVNLPGNLITKELNMKCFPSGSAPPAGEAPDLSDIEAALYISGAAPLPASGSTFSLTANCTGTQWAYFVFTF